MVSQLISVHSEELQFQFEPEKESFCDLKVTNSTEHHVAFKVKTTSPEKFFVRPNMGVIQPWGSCILRVTLRAQKVYPPFMQCKDKFLLLNTRVPPNTNIDELPSGTFKQKNGKGIDGLKLWVVYVSPKSGEEDTTANDNKALQRMKYERDQAMRQAQQLQQELETLKRNMNKSKVGGFSLSFGVNIVSNVVRTD